MGQLLLLVTVVTIMGSKWDRLRIRLRKTGNDKNQVNLQGLRESWGLNVWDLESWSLTGGNKKPRGSQKALQRGDVHSSWCSEAGQ